MKVKTLTILFLVLLLPSATAFSFNSTNDTIGHTLTDRNVTITSETPVFGDTDLVTPIFTDWALPCNSLCKKEVEGSSFFELDLNSDNTSERALYYLKPSNHQQNIELLDKTNISEGGVPRYYGPKNELIFRPPKQTSNKIDYYTLPLRVTSDRFDIIVPYLKYYESPKNKYHCPISFETNIEPYKTVFYATGNDQTTYYEFNYANFSSSSEYGIQKNHHLNVDSGKVGSSYAFIGENKTLLVYVPKNSFIITKSAKKDAVSICSSKKLNLEDSKPVFYSVFNSNPYNDLNELQNRSIIRQMIGEELKRFSKHRTTENTRIKVSDVQVTEIHSNEFREGNDALFTINLDSERMPFENYTITYPRNSTHSDKKTITEKEETINDEIYLRGAHNLPINEKYLYPFTKFKGEIQADKPIFTTNPDDNDIRKTDHSELVVEYNMEPNKVEITQRVPLNHFLGYSLLWIILGATSLYECKKVRKEKEYSLKSTVNGLFALSTAFSGILIKHFISILVLAYAFWIFLPLFTYIAVSERFSLNLEKLRAMPHNLKQAVR